MSQGMARKILIALTLAFAFPAVAQGQAAPRALPPDMQTLEDMARAMREALEAFGGTLAPWAEQLGALIEEPGAYEPPVRLPNGDILIRRKPDAPPLTPRDAQPGLDL